MDIVDLNSQITQDLAVLQEQVTFHEKRAEAVKDTPWRSKIHLQTRDRFRQVTEHILELQAKLTEANTNLAAAKNQSKLPISNPSSRLSLSLEEIEGLPPELIQELSIDINSFEFTVVGLIDEAGGVLSLDKILIALYKKTGEIHKRQNLNNRLYRMEKAGQLFKIPGKKSAYSTRQLSLEEIEHLIKPLQAAESEEPAS